MKNFKTNAMLLTLGLLVSGTIMHAAAHPVPAQTPQQLTPAQQADDFNNRINVLASTWFVPPTENMFSKKNCNHESPYFKNITDKGAEWQKLIKEISAFVTQQSDVTSASLKTGIQNCTIASNKLLDYIKTEIPQFITKFSTLAEPTAQKNKEANAKIREQARRERSQMYDYRLNEASTDFNKKIDSDYEKLIISLFRQGINRLLNNSNDALKKQTYDSVFTINSANKQAAKRVVENLIQKLRTLANRVEDDTKKMKERLKRYVVIPMDSKL